jgi:integrase
VNRELCLISTVFTQAMKEWRLGLTANPCSLVTKPRKPRARTQRVFIAERKKIIEQLGWDGKSEPESSSQWVAFAFYLALETAMRKGEILSLRWADIDFDARHAHLDITKNGDERDVPLSKAATTLLRIVKKRKPAAPVVPMQTGHFDKLFRKAKDDAGLSHIRFHDSRREAATTMAAKLSNVLELAAITGHKGPSTRVITRSILVEPSQFLAKALIGSYLNHSSPRQSLSVPTRLLFPLRQMLRCWRREGDSISFHRAPNDICGCPPFEP